MMVEYLCLSMVWSFVFLLVGVIMGLTICAIVSHPPRGRHHRDRF